MNDNDAYVISHTKTILTNIRSNGKTHGFWTDDKQVAELFEMVSWTAEQLRKKLEWMKLNSWTAQENFWTVRGERQKKIRTASGERLNGRRKISNGSWWMAERQKNFKWLALNGRRKNFERLEVNRLNGYQYRASQSETQRDIGHVRRK